MSYRTHAIVFVLSLGLFLAWQYRGMESGGRDYSLQGGEGATAESAVAISADSKSGGNPGDVEGMRSNAEDAARPDYVPGAATTSPRAVRPAETYLYEYDAEWVEDLYVDLHSPDVPLPEVAEDVPVISGRVLTPSGRPVPDVEITARPRDYFKTGGDEPAHRTITNGDGFYAFSMLPAGIHLVGTEPSPQYAASRLEVRTGVKYADLVLEPQRMTTVRGVITDPMGQELGQVRVMPLVKGLPTGGVSNEDGEFAFGLSLENEARNFPVTFKLKGFREQRYQVNETNWTEDGGIWLPITMEPIYEYGSITGSVKGPDGEQASGDVVRLYSPSLMRNYKATVDAGGEYRMADLEVADDYQLWIQPNGPYRDFSESNLSIVPGSLRRDIVLEPLDRSHRLKGQILDQGGKPVPNYTLVLRSLASSGQSIPVTSDGWGSFEVGNVPEGELVFESQTMPYHRISGFRVGGDRYEHEVDLTIIRGREKLLGLVVDEDGRPVAASTVFITASQSSNGLSSRLSSTTRADASGRFLFTDLGDGHHTITVAAPGYERARVQPEIGSQRELVITLERKSSLASSSD